MLRAQVCLISCFWLTSASSPCAENCLAELVYAVGCGIVSTRCNRIVDVSFFGLLGDKIREIQQTQHFVSTTLEEAALLQLLGIMTMMKSILSLTLALIATNPAQAKICDYQFCGGTITNPTATVTSLDGTQQSPCSLVQ